MLPGVECWHIFADSKKVDVEIEEMEAAEVKKPSYREQVRFSRWSCTLHFNLCRYLFIFAHKKWIGIVDCYLNVTIIWSLLYPVCLPAAESLTLLCNVTWLFLWS